MIEVKYVEFGKWTLSAGMSLFNAHDNVALYKFLMIALELPTPVDMITITAIWIDHRENNTLIMARTQVKDQGIVGTIDLRITTTDKVTAVHV